jgi:hypothetical protein
MARTRVTIDRQAVHAIVDRRARPGVEAAARFMADQQRQTVPSRRVSAAVGHESGKDMRGWYARAGMPQGTQRSAAFLWYFFEYGTGRGINTPFIRPSLFNNTRRVAQLMTGGRI